MRLIDWGQKAHLWACSPGCHSEMPLRQCKCYSLDVANWFGIQGIIVNFTANIVVVVVVVVVVQTVVVAVTAAYSYDQVVLFGIQGIIVNFTANIVVVVVVVVVVVQTVVVLTAVLLRSSSTRIVNNSKFWKKEKKS